MNDTSLNGREIYGYCEGLFGRDFYGPARIEAYAHDWVIVRSFSGEVFFGYGSDWKDHIGWEDEEDED